MAHDAPQKFHPAASAGSLAPGEGRSVDIGGRRFALFNLLGQFHAMDDSCPHRQAPLGAGFIEDTRVYCPMHGWCFEITTGACVSNPERPVRTYPVRVENGEIEIYF